MRRLDARVGAEGVSRLLHAGHVAMLREVRPFETIGSEHFAELPRFAGVGGGDDQLHGLSTAVGATPASPGSRGDSKGDAGAAPTGSLSDRFEPPPAARVARRRRLQQVWRRRLLGARLLRIVL